VSTGPSTDLGTPLATESPADSRRDSAMHNACCGHDHSEPPFPYGGRGHVPPVLSAAAIEVRELSVRYPFSTREILCDLGLSVVRGERVALVGPNGAGKSTLLKTLAGLLKPHRGTILISGNRVGACHHRTAYLPQRSDLDWQFPMSAAELVLTGRYVHLGWFRRPTRRDRVLAGEALDRLGMIASADQRISDLSGGQQQRILLARALVQEASIFLLDEPLNAVDDATRELVNDVLQEQAARGGCVLAATHDLGRLTEAFDRAEHLIDGRLRTLPTSSWAGRENDVVVNRAI